MVGLLALIDTSDLGSLLALTATAAALSLISSRIARVLLGERRRRRR